MLKWAVVLILFIVGGLAAYQAFWGDTLDTMYDDQYGSPPP